MTKLSNRSLIAGMALAVGLTGAAQAEPFNIFTASKAHEASAAQLETVQYRHHRHRRGINPGAAVAIGAMGVIAGAAAASAARDRYYYDDYYYGRPAPRYYQGRSSYYGPPPSYYYEDDCAPRPDHYPKVAGCP